MSEQIETLEISEERGNTNSLSSRVQPNQLKRWFFTWNNYTETSIGLLETTFDRIDCEYIFQQEKGAEGTKHLQGCIFLKWKMRWSAFGLPREIHWEKMKGTREQSIAYCSKEETRDGQVYTNIRNIYVTEPLKKIETLYPWQQQVFDLTTNSADNRTIHWIWDMGGNVGKTSLGLYFYDNRNCMFIAGGKTSDIINGIFNMKIIDSKSVVIFNIPRSHENKVSYTSLEMIKDGLIFNSKYETGARRFNPPHIIVFANFPPDTAKLSSDRWNIKEIKDGALV